jgi:GT2 family glycosyltransferase
MHRSGTSALMGVLNVLGVDLGSNYLNPSEDNPKGFFENISITEINEKILQSLNSSWNDVFFLPENWWNSEHLHPYRQEIIDIIKSEFHGKVIFGIKDPRISRLLPLWNAIFKELSTEPHYIIPLRSPLEVARSLQKRNGFSIEKSLLLLMNYMMDAEFHTRGFPRAFVSFDELLKDPEKTINHISKILGLTFLKDYNEVKDEIERFLEPSLKHHTFKMGEINEDLLEPIVGYHRLLLNLTDKERISNVDLLEIDNVREKFLNIYRLFYHENVVTLYRQMNQTITERDQIIAERDLLSDTLNLIYQSNFWKIANKYYEIRDNTSIFRYTYKFLRVIKNEGFGIFLKKLSRTIRESIGRSEWALRKFLPAHIKDSSVKNINKYDIIFFSIIDWDFRYQRPQHIAARFAKNGNRIFYLCTTLKKQNSYSMRKITENIYEIILPFHTDDIIYGANLEVDITKPLEAMKKLFTDFRIKESVAFVEFPLWYPIVNRLREEFGTKVLFDCLDDYSGFRNVDANIEQVERQLLKCSDYCITPSTKLYGKLKDKCENIAIVRNATEFEHFHNLPPNDVLSDVGKPIIGYYGAIAEWFDSDVTEYIADQKPQWSIVLIGHASGYYTKKLKAYKNIHFLGEKPYTKLPKYLYWFDVCIIPFKITDLTLSTNPVKFYEFISSGKPVVSSKLPELLPYANLLYLSESKEEFLKNIELALKESDEDLKKKRIETAKANDWDYRFKEIHTYVKSAYPLVSVTIVTFNNLKHTQLCIESIYGKTAYPNFELIIVDNASSDGTPDYLNSLKEQYDNVKIVLNSENLGFAAANNIGIRESKGEYIILLNNDTVVTRGWISGLIKYLKNPDIGMVGPVTNSIGNEAKINVEYKNLYQMELFSDSYTAKNKGIVFEITVLALFCAAFRKETIGQVGLLDEQFSVGMFEDDDYAIRVKRAGFKIICAEDVFIHHFGGVSFSKLQSAEYKKIFDENKKKYELKWGIKWQPHRYRDGVV